MKTLKYSWESRGHICIDSRRGFAYEISIAKSRAYWEKIKRGVKISA